MRARILFGGGRPAGVDTGYYVAPTAIVDVASDARVCQEEIFGPVAVIIPFEDRDEALAIANDSIYGLAGYIWTESQTTAHYVSHRLQTGMIWINDGFDRDLRQPFGGVKQSGTGRRRRGPQRASSSPRPGSCRSRSHPADRLRTLRPDGGGAIQ